MEHALLISESLRLAVLKATTVPGDKSTTTTIVDNMQSNENHSAIISLTSRCLLARGIRLARVHKLVNNLHKVQEIDGSVAISIYVL